MPSRKTWTALLLAAGAAAACAETALGQAANIDLSDPRAVTQLEADLGSDDFAIRQRGQTTLEHIYNDRREALRRVAQGAGDPEVRAHMLARVDALEELALTDPPGISVDFDGATLDAVAAALSAAQPVPIATDARHGRGNANERFTLKADSQPFWEIERQLSAQYPIWFDSSADGVMLVRDAGWRQSVRVRGFEVCVQEPRLPDPQGVSDRNISVPIGSRAKYVCVMGLGLDPRLAVAAIGLPKLDVTDNSGAAWKYTVLDAHPGPKAAKVITFNRTLALEPPANEGDAVNLKGAWPVMLQLGEDRAEISRFDEPPEEPLFLGNAEVTIDRLFLINAAGVSTLQITTEVTLAAGTPPPTAANPAVPITMTLLDAAGNEVGARSIGMETFKSSATIALKGEPAKLVLTRPGKTREFEVPFEFRNLAVKR